MTIYAADLEKISHWATESSRMIEQAQTMAELPDDHRSYPPIRTGEALEITGLGEWTWREYVRSLPPEDRLSAGGHIRASLADVHNLMDLKGIRPNRPAHVPRGTRIAVENFKGGSSKSTTCLHLGVALARRGYRILLIDTDPQATLTQMLGVRSSQVAPEETLLAAFLGVDPSKEPTFQLKPRKTYISGLSLLPSNLHMSGLEVEVVRELAGGSSNALNLQARFDAALSSIDKDFDMVFVDFQPAFSMTQALLLRTMDSLIIPMPTESADFAGTRDFLYQIGAVLASIEKLSGTKKIWDPLLVVHTRLRKGADLIDEIAATTFGVNRLIEHVPDQPAISAALSTMRSVFEVGPDVYDRRAIKRAQEQYDALALKVADIIKKRWDEMAEEQSNDQ